ncbi:MAG: hypothetical protein HPY83_17550 [Anaerolineae bacterium]|nr:hypothetical protein [Anaerolineae bacterium]
MPRKRRDRKPARAASHSPNRHPNTGGAHPNRTCLTQTRAADREAGAGRHRHTHRYPAVADSHCGAHEHTDSTNGAAPYGLCNSPGCHHPCADASFYSLADSRTH